MWRMLMDRAAERLLEDHRAAQLRAQIAAAPTSSGQQHRLICPAPFGSIGRALPSRSTITAIARLCGVLAAAGLTADGAEDRCRGRF
jgi:hypothetical protein